MSIILSIFFIGLFILGYVVGRHFAFVRRQLDSDDTKDIIDEVVEKVKSKRVSTGRVISPSQNNKTKKFLKDLESDI